MFPSLTISFERFPFIDFLADKSFIIIRNLILVIYHQDVFEFFKIASEIGFGATEFRHTTIIAAQKCERSGAWLKFPG